MDTEKVVFQEESRLFRLKIGFSGPEPKRGIFSVHPYLTIPVPNTNLGSGSSPFHQNWQARDRKYPKGSSKDTDSNGKYSMDTEKVTFQLESHLFGPEKPTFQLKSHLFRAHHVLEFRSRSPRKIYWLIYTVPYCMYEYIYSITHGNIPSNFIPPVIKQLT